MILSKNLFVIRAEDWKLNVANKRKIPTVSIQYCNDFNQNEKRTITTWSKDVTRALAEMGIVQVRATTGKFK